MRTCRSRRFQPIWLGPTRILELGAGSGWLSHRLAALGYRVVAVDRSTTRPTDWARAGTIRWRSRPCRPTSTAAVRAAAVRSRGLQRLAALLAGSRREPARGRAHARRRRDRRGDGFADVRARRPTARRWWPISSSACAPNTASPSRCAPGSGFLTYAALERAFAALGLRGALVSVARPAGLAAPAAGGPPCACGARRRRSASGWPDDRPLQPAVDDAGKQPLPLSVLSLAAVLEGRAAWALVDGNVTADPAAAIVALLSQCAGVADALLAVTVMPGPQLTQAVEVCRGVRRDAAARADRLGRLFPDPAHRHRARSPFVDFVVRSQGERALLALHRQRSRHRPRPRRGALACRGRRPADRSSTTRRRR